MAAGVAGNSAGSAGAKHAQQPAQTQVQQNQGLSDYDKQMNHVYQDRYIDEFSGMIPTEVKETKTNNGEMKLTAIYPNGKVGHFEGMELIGKFIKTPEYRQFLEGKLGVEPGSTQY